MIQFAADAIDLEKLCRKLAILIKMHGGRITLNAGPCWTGWCVQQALLGLVFMGLANDLQHGNALR